MIVPTIAQYTDLVTQMDGVFTKLNSNATARVASSIFLDMEEMFDNLNTEKVKDQLSQNVIKMGDFLDMITGDKMHSIISNMERATADSKVYVNSKEWNLEAVIVLLEILLVLLIILTSIVLTLLIMKLCKKKKPDFVPHDIYNFMPENPQQNIDM